MVTILQIKNISNNGNRCRSIVHHDFSKILGVYGVKSDMINGMIEILHTDEVSIPLLIQKIRKMGYEAKVLPF